MSWGQCLALEVWAPWKSWLDDWQELFVKHFVDLKFCIHDSLIITSSVGPLFRIPPQIYFDRMLGSANHLQLLPPSMKAYLTTSFEVNQTLVHEYHTSWNSNCFSLSGSLISWKYFVPDCTHPSFHHRHLTFALRNEPRSKEGTFLWTSAMSVHCYFPLGGW